MLKEIVLLIALIFAVKTPSSAQILVYNGDTLSCYTEAELGKITKATEKVKELDTLLKTCRAGEVYLLAQIREYEEVRLNLDQIVVQKDIMISGRDKIISDQQGEINKLNKDVKKQRVLKVIGTGFFAVTTIIALIL